MKESASGDGEVATNRTSRRDTLRVLAGAGATGLLGTLAGCEGGIKEMKPAGQTVVYKTPKNELREGTMGFSITNETETPNAKPKVDTEEYVASVRNTRGQLSLSPDAATVAYVEADSKDISTAIVIQSLNGGDTKHTRSELQEYWGADIRSIAHGNLLSLDWCSTTGSDKIAVSVDGWTEMDGQLLFEFDPYSGSMEPFGLEDSTNPLAPNVAWSPSCDKIAYMTETNPGYTNAPLTVLNVSTEENTRRVQNGKDPAWGDTGIAFVRDGNVYLDRQSDTVQLTASSSADSNLVIFEQAPGESLAFLRDGQIHLIERIDELGSNPNPTPTKVQTEQNVETFDIVD